MDNRRIYASFLRAPTGKYWKRIGARRRAGVATPLFSIYSKKSVGVGDLADLILLVDWAKSVGISIIQLLPMNDVGFNFRPYDSESSFALDPMYLSLEKFIAAECRPFSEKIKGLRKQFPIGKRVDTGIKAAKLEFLWKVFETSFTETAGFKKFVRENSFWLESYALFKTAKSRFQQKGWQEWPEEWELSKEEKKVIQFHRWLQWELFNQLIRF